MCVNPKHLYLGTAKDNAGDRMSRGRYRTRVTGAERDLILNPNKSPSEIANELNRGIATIWRIRKEAKKT